MPPTDQPPTHHPASTDEWETPDPIVSTFEAEFGPFDLDPCATDETAKADQYFTRVEDGLQQPWFGQVWLNPPYSDPRPWLEKAIAEIAAGRVRLVVACLPGVIDTSWFHDLVVGRAEIRFHRRRIRFLGRNHQPVGMPRQGTTFAIYRGQTP